MRAALCEKEVACLLEAEGEDLEAAIHYVSAASCYARAQQYADAIPLLRAALSFTLRDSHRKEVEALLKEWLPKAKRDLRKQARKQPAAVS
ncbi:MAG: hypothetical protein HYR84_07615 [Planctomycetes bacterium]|nr:hypothetical protein [Planctomycetota bacterium]